MSTIIDKIGMAKQSIKNSILTLVLKNVMIKKKCVRKIMEVYELIEKYFDLVIRYIVLGIELIGTIVLVYAIISAVVGLFKRQQHVRLKLAEGIALALEFKIGGELLRTVVVREWSELLILGAIILLRAALTFLIQWEIKIERKNGNLSASQLKDIKTPLTQDEPPREKGLFGKFFQRDKRSDKQNSPAPTEQTDDTTKHDE